jgi:CRISPR-associated protein (TIGR02584 family)
MAATVDPIQFPRKILLAVTGLAPQILTETLYALVVGKPAFIPDEVHVITTREGAEYARHTLLDSGMGRLNGLLRDYGLTGRCHFSAGNIHVITDASGHPLSDIQTPEENLRAANVITDLVRRFTRSPDTAVHVSIAGGRKTMGFFMGYALSLYGRPQDRLSHVLVSQPFESNHEFYYPPPEPRILFDRGNKPIDTADAKVILADIPFVRLRTGLPTALIDGQASFGDVVAAAQTQFNPPRLEIDLENKRLTCADRVVPMQPILLAYYAWLAWRKQEGLAPIRYTDADPAEFLSLYAHIIGRDASDYERTADELQNGMEKEFFEQKKSLANAALKRALGHEAQPYLIQPVGRRPMTRYEARPDAEHIVMIKSPRENKR